MEERADGSEFSILRGCVILECLGGFLFPSPRENREFVTKRVRRLRIFDSQRLPFGASWRLLVSLFSPCENRESVDRGLGGAELVTLREDFSGEGELLFHYSNLSSAIC